MKSIDWIKKPRQFVIKGIIFLSIFLLVNLAVNVLYNRLVLSHSYLFRMEAQFKEYKDTTHILISGDSHAMADINPNYLDGSFCVATSGENMIETYYHLKYYLERENLDIRMVILPIDLHSFSAFRIDRFESPMYWRKYVDYMELGREMNDIPTFLSYETAGNIAYLDGIEGSIDLLKIESGYASGADLLIRGCRVRKNFFYHETNPLASAQTRAGFHLKDYDILHPDAVRFFTRILDLLESHGVTVVLVRFPITQEYYQAAGEIMDIDAFYYQINKILENHTPPITVLDYHDLYWSKPLYFHDSDHLNAIGSIEFTKKINKDLEEMGLLP